MVPFLGANLADQYYEKEEYRVYFGHRGGNPYCELVLYRFQEVFDEVTNTEYMQRSTVVNVSTKTEQKILK